MRFMGLVVSALMFSACASKTEGDKEDTTSADESEGLDRDLDGYTPEDGDCDDTNGSINPGEEDSCDGIDNNCDGVVDELGATTFYIDYDGDGFGTDRYTLSACEPGEGWVSNSDDCDDTDDTVNPDAAELCDGLDNDCDGAEDEDLSRVYNYDADGDGFGDPLVSAEMCEASDGYVLDSRDCDDTDPDINPGSPEVCDGIDNNCREGVDEGFGGLVYIDFDGDGYGDPDAPVDSCGDVEGGVADSSDCDDTDPEVHPDADEICDGIDNDCSGSVDDIADSATFYLDLDGDGFGRDAPSLTLSSCDIPDGYVAYDGDCDDDDPLIHPEALELCDGIDNNCNLLIDEAGSEPVYTDADGDGFGDPSTGLLISACDGGGEGMIADGTDCDDTDPTVFPGAVEVCDGIDNDCDTEVDEGLGEISYLDLDGDGYGDPLAPVTGCDGGGGGVADMTDCDDTDASVYPGAPELCDGLDNDCDVDVDEEEDCSSTCGDGVLDPGEEVDPPESTFLTIDVDPDTCRWDFSEVEQLFCNSGCSWAGGFGCDDADADVFCKLRTGNPLSEAESYTIESARSAPGFPCPSGYPTVYTDRGVSETVYYTDLDLLTTHGSGDVITDPICTDP